MVIQKENRGERVVRARAQVLLRVHPGPTVTFPGPEAGERKRERKKFENIKTAGHETGEH